MIFCAYLRSFFSIICYKLINIINILLIFCRFKSAVRCNYKVFGFLPLRKYTYIYLFFRFILDIYSFL
jgi:hypothetical protein